ncbi:MAG: ComF family protein [Planctomycetales bacterium]|nr:ComF family protein [Planctomycetales bacterium]
MWNAIGKFTHSSVEALKSLVFPACCSFCSHPTSSSADGLCFQCHESLTWEANQPACPSCGIPIKNREISIDCPECAVRSFRFDRLIRLGNYKGSIRNSVIRIKNFGEYPLARSLGRLLADQVRDTFSGQLLPDFVVPMPSHWRKRLVRGHNSPESLAKEIAFLANIPLLLDVLICQRQPHKQALLSSAERHQNLKGTFRLRANYDLIGAHILLVDDIITTGATANEATRVLKDAKVGVVSVAVLGRASNYDLLDLQRSDSEDKEQRVTS